MKTLIITLAFAAIAAADIPYPSCFPCPGGGAFATAKASAAVLFDIPYPSCFPCPGGGA